MRRHLKVVGGCTLIFIGLLGMVLPIIPGIPILVAGVAILGTDHPIVRPFARRFERLRKRYTNSKSNDEDEKPSESQPKS
ncbi:MAG: hypothetical protein WBV94_06275 [Blastocatellia bacterium]